MHNLLFNFNKWIKIFYQVYYATLLTLLKIIMHKIVKWNLSVDAGRQHGVQCSVQVRNLELGTYIPK